MLETALLDWKAVQDNHVFGTGMNSHSPWFPELTQTVWI